MFESYMAKNCRCRIRSSGILVIAVLALDVLNVTYFHRIGWGMNIMCMNFKS